MAEAKPRVAVVVGAMNADIQAWSLDENWREGDSNPGLVSETPGGVGRNIAENLLRLGFRSSLVTVLGDDARASWLEADCRRLGLDLSASLRLEGRGSPVYLCLLDGAGRLVGAVADMGALDSLDPAFVRGRFDLMDGADLLVIDANLGAETIAVLAERYGRGGTLDREGRPRPRLVWDPVSVAKAGRGRAVLGRFDLIKPNRAEAAALTGSADPSPQALAAALRRLLGSEPPLFLSLGAEGLFFEGGEVRGKGRHGIVRPPSLPLVSVSGAGDAALASLARDLVLGGTLEEMAARAIAAAALTASSRETVFPGLNAGGLEALAQGVEHEFLS